MTALQNESPQARHKRLDYLKNWRATHVDHKREQNRLYMRRYRLQILSHYSPTDPPSCNCCGETIYEFLSIDHINGGGTAHRKALGSKFIYSYLIQNGYPTGYQVLCHNCNQAKGFYKECPHKARQFETEDIHA